ncbi:exported hypothetical protein [Mesorhizobium plurifarium]|uniref:Uncharacterized protein n=1 Tax=Mesorhizobium plurifarium TaxID=69974 RepID=A0A090E611_MESPL|nr:exported hypothetical protein [Mesorhizobium plurifarium]
MLRGEPLLLILRRAASGAAASEPDHAVGLQEVEAHEDDGDQRHLNRCPAHARVPR